jgi:hypothetical protein
MSTTTATKNEVSAEVRNAIEWLDEYNARPKAEKVFTLDEVVASWIKDRNYRAQHHKAYNAKRTEALRMMKAEGRL